MTEITFSSLVTRRIQIFENHLYLGSNPHLPPCDCFKASIFGARHYTRPRSRVSNIVTSSASQAGLLTRGVPLFCIFFRYRCPTTNLAAVTDETSIFVTWIVDSLTFIYILTYEVKPGNLVSLATRYSCFIPTKGIYGRLR